MTSGGLTQPRIQVLVCFRERERPTKESLQASATSLEKPPHARTNVCAPRRRVADFVGANQFEPWRELVLRLASTGRSLSAFDTRSGEPNLRELEPDRGLAPPVRRTPRRGLEPACRPGRLPVSWSEFVPQGACGTTDVPTGGFPLTAAEAAGPRAVRPHRPHGAVQRLDRLPQQPSPIWSRRSPAPSSELQREDLYEWHRIPRCCLADRDV